MNFIFDDIIIVVYGWFLRQNITKIDTQPNIVQRCVPKTFVFQNGKILDVIVYEKPLSTNFSISLFFSLCIEEIVLFYLE